MADYEETEMVVVDGIRWPLELLKKRFPEMVKDAVPLKPVADFGHGKRVTTVPGGVVTGETALGTPVVDTTVSAAGNGVIVDGPGESGGPGDEGTVASNRSARRSGSKK